MTATADGIERDRSLVRAASELARTLGVADWTDFLHGDVDAIGWRHFDGFFLSDPGGLTASELGRIEEGLTRTRPSTRVVTYRRFAGLVPAGFDQITCDHLPGGDLRLWTKRWPRRRDHSAARGQLAA